MAKKKKGGPRTEADGVPVYCSYDEIVGIETLKAYPGNPNEHPDEQIELLKKIILNNGWRAPITVSNLSGYIVKGHGRYMAAARAGWSKVPIDRQDYKSTAEEVRDLIADNKISELSEVDDELARDLMLTVEDDDFDAENFGFTLEEFEAGSGGDPRERSRKIKTAEVEFSKEILLEHNYVVLYFDNAFDWQVAMEKFGLKKVRDLIPRKGQPVGIGRVIDGAEWLERID